MHYIAQSLVCCQVVVEAVPPRLTDSRLFRSASPVHDIMSRTQSGMRSSVVCVHLRAVSCHSHRHAPHIGVAGPEELVPEHCRRCQLSVVPCISPDIISPFVAAPVVCVHDIAVVEESVPSMAFYLRPVESHYAVERVLHSPVALCLPCRQAPYPECPFPVHILCCWQHLCALVRLAVYDYCRGAGNAPCCAHARLHILVCR